MNGRQGNRLEGQTAAGPKRPAKAWIVSVPIVASLLASTMYGASNLVLLPALGALVFVALVQRESVSLRGEHGLWLLFWLTFAVATWTSPFVALQSDTLSFLLAVSFVILVSSLSYSPRELRTVAGVYVAAATLAAGSVLLNVINGHQAVWHRYSTSFFGVDRDPNYIAAYIAPAVLLCGIRLVGGSAQRVSGLVLLSVLVAGALATGSRGGAIVVMASIAFLLLLALRTGAAGRRRFIRYLMIVAALLATAFSWLAVFLPDTLVDRLSSPDSLLNDESRLDAWRLALELIPSHPIIGVGLNGANWYSEQVLGYPTHNVYIDILTGSGLLGALFFLLAFVLQIRGKPGDRMLLYGLAGAFLAPLAFINGFNTLNFWVPILVLSVFASTSRGSACGLIVALAGQDCDERVLAEPPRPHGDASRKATAIPKSLPSKPSRMSNHA